MAQHWSVRAAADGLQALEVARAWLPDLILTDVMLPNLDGFAFLGNFSSRCAAMNANAADTVACCTRSSRCTRSTKSMFE